MQNSVLFWKSVLKKCICRRHHSHTDLWWKGQNINKYNLCEGEDEVKLSLKFKNGRL